MHRRAAAHSVRGARMAQGGRPGVDSAARHRRGHRRDHCSGTLLTPAPLLAIAIQPNHVAAIGNRGNVLRQLTRLPEAEAAYRRALAINPNHPETLNNLGTVLRDQGKAARRRMKRVHIAVLHGHESVIGLARAARVPGRGIT